MRRIKTVYWALIAVLAALAFFLIAGVLLGRGAASAEGTGPPER